MANTSTLATTVSYLFRDGRFYGWEGVNCCPGTCTHVWHYAQAPGRLFPQIERLLRRRVDFGIGQHADGAISHRTFADKGSHHADDGHCGRILGVYREHQMCDDDRFLRELWPKVKQAIEFMFTRDPNRDGISRRSSTQYTGCGMVRADQLHQFVAHRGDARRRADGP